MQFLGVDVHGKTLGIVGAGRIGTAVARRATGFSMNLLYCSRNRHEEIESLGARRVDLETLLRERDFVSLHVPQTPEIRHLIGKPELALMKPTAILINTSRGPVVDEKALYKALKEGWIAGAALDVFAQEPLPAESPLWDVDPCQVILSPHVAGFSLQYDERASGLFAENLRRYLAGRPLLNLIDKGRQY